MELLPARRAGSMTGSWWMLGLITSTMLFALLVALLLLSQLLRREMPRGPKGRVGARAQGLDSSCLPQCSRLVAGLNTWMTRIFVAMVLQCAFLSLLSQYPASRSPLWLGLVLQGFTYASAAIYHLSDRGDYLEEVFPKER